MANFDCIYAAVTIRQMPSDERLEIVLCKLEMNTEMHYKYIKRSSDKCGERRKKKKKKDVTMKSNPHTSSNSSVSSLSI